LSVRGSSQQAWSQFEAGAEVPDPDEQGCVHCEAGNGEQAALHLRRTHHADWVYQICEYESPKGRLVLPWGGKPAGAGPVDQLYLQDGILHAVETGWPIT